MRTLDESMLIAQVKKGRLEKLVGVEEEDRVRIRIKSSPAADNESIIITVPNGNRYYRVKPNGRLEYAKRKPDAPSVSPDVIFGVKDGMKPILSVIYNLDVRKGEVDLASANWFSEQHTLLAYGRLVRGIDVVISHALKRGHYPLE